MSGQYPFIPPSPLEDGALLQSARRRQRAVQPPSLLTTSLSNAQSVGLGLGLNPQTPLSSTSLSSPFSIHQGSHYPISSEGAARGTSPMALRSALSGIYNPQQWGPISNENSPIPATVSTFPSSQTRLSTRVTTFATQPRGPDGENCCSIDEN